MGVGNNPLEYVNLSTGEDADVPPGEGVVTVISTVPAASAGLVTVIEVSLLTVIAPVAFGVPPNMTSFAPVKPTPVMVTGVPPAVEPAVGETPVTVGSGVYVNQSAGEFDADEPPGSGHGNITRYSSRARAEHCD